MKTEIEEISLTEMALRTAYGVVFGLSVVAVLVFLVVIVADEALSLSVSQLLFGS